MYVISNLTGNIYLNGVLVPQDDTNQMWLNYWNYREAGGLINYVEATESELNEKQVPESISQMKLRKQLILSANLRCVWICYINLYILKRNISLS